MIVTFLKDADKDLDKIPQPDKNRILAKIIAYSQHKPAGVKKLKNREEYRLRVGDYRVLFLLNSDNMEVQRILHRKNVYNL